MRGDERPCFSSALRAARETTVQYYYEATRGRSSNNLKKTRKVPSTTFQRLNTPKSA